MAKPSGIFSVFERKKGGLAFFTGLEKITGQKMLVDFAL